MFRCIVGNILYNFETRKSDIFLGNGKKSAICAILKSDMFEQLLGGGGLKPPSPHPPPLLRGPWYNGKEVQLPEITRWTRPISNVALVMCQTH